MMNAVAMVIAIILQTRDSMPCLPYNPTRKPYPQARHATPNRQSSACD